MTALELANIHKRFGETAALHGATLSVQPGTLHALLGENGAGKTTLMRIAFGMIQADDGAIRLNGQPCHFNSPREAIHAGLGMVHQHFMLVPAMSIAENVALGGRGVLNLQSVRERVRSIANQYKLALDPDAIVGQLPVGAQQRTEIVKALAHDAKVLILDEPTAVLTATEARDLLLQLRAFADRGGTVVLITHKLRDALAFADEITVLRHGRTVLTRPTATVTEHELASAMIGSAWLPPHSIGDSPKIPSTGPTQVPILSLDNASFHDSRDTIRVRETTLTIRSREIVGVVAVEGNGQYELLRLLAGRLRPTQGQVRLPGVVGFVPEDRHRDGLILDFSLTENVALPGAGRRHGKIAWQPIRRLATKIVSVYDVRTNDIETTARTLSGGNQQKLVLGRELESGSGALVVENPTRGLDIQATATIHRRLRAARNQGTAVVVYSSDLDEVLLLADRVLVVFDGHVTEPPKDRETIGRAMLGST